MWDRAVTSEMDTAEMDTPWDGRGLPPAARARLERSRADRVRASLLPVAGAAGLAACGLTPVGEVMGCIVEHLGWSGFGCPYYGYGYGSSGIGGPTVTSGGGYRWGGYAPYADALYRGYDTALGRMLEEAKTLDADGV